MSEKYKNTKRCYLIDHHSPQPPDVLLNHLDIQEYEKFFETANIDSLMVYCKDHWGVTYYPSQVKGARQHEGVKKDWIREVSTLLKKKDIEFIAYYCIEYDEGAARRFPEWRVRRADGSYLIRDDEFAKWSLCCYQTGYREYCLQQLEEIVKNYHPDALFMDIFGASLCYCDHCRKKFYNRFQYELPETEEGVLEHKADIIAFLNDNAKEFLDEVKKRTKAIDPDLAITINFSCHYPQEIRDMLDYQFSEPLLKDNWFSSAYARDTAIGNYPILVPGEASQVYNYSSFEEYLCDLSSIAAQGCRVGMYSGSQHIDGTLDFEEARLLGAVYNELKKMEPYFSNRYPVKCAGIIQSDMSMGVNIRELNADAILRAKRHNPHQNAVLGAMQLCEHAKIPFMVLPEKTLDSSLLKQFQVIILPEVYVIPEEEAVMLEEYVRNGGIVLSSGQSGLWNADSTKRETSTIAKLLGIGEATIHNEYADNRWSAYLFNPGVREFTGLLSCTTPPVSEHFVETTAEGETEVLLELIKPCVACDESHWVNWWSPPPALKPSCAGLFCHKVGEGHAYYMAFDFFTMASQESFQYPNTLFKDILGMENIVPVIQNITDIPNIIRTAYFETEEYYIIHQVSMMPKSFHGNIVPVSGGSLKLQVPVKEVKMVYPEKRILETESINGETVISLPEFTSQQMILCYK